LGRHTIGRVEAGAVAGRVHLPRRWRINRRLIGLAILIATVASFLAYMMVQVPLAAPKLSREEATRFWWAALVGALVVAAGVALVVREALSARRASPATALGGGGAAGSDATPLVPRSLRLESVPGSVVRATAIASLVWAAAALLAQVPLWVGGLALVLPWIPLVAVEARWKYARDGIFAAFAMLVLLQVLHMGEHTMQVGQLLVHRGDLAVSHGVFGQLDFELVHFVTDTSLWVVLGLLLVIYRGRNGWLWVAFAAASLHQVEHFYLFWLYNAHEPVYAAGGFAGIMGEAGMIGSPLDRPYLHFTYNFIVVVPMVLAVWDEARRVDSAARR
jgi:hypothetical protein